MRYTFMNKNVELFDLAMERGKIDRIMNFRVENKHLLPIFLLPKRNMGISKADFADWWSGRRIPASRDGIKELQFHLNINLDELAEKCWGLSLSDQYWIRPSEDIKWEDVNFFDHDFSEDIGELLISGDWNDGSLMSPDNTSDGVVKKRWKIVNGQRFLMKGSFGPLIQTHPFREVFASKIAATLFKEFSGRFVVPYHLVREDTRKGNRVFSACPNFVTKDTEYVSFKSINFGYKRDNSISPFHFCRNFYGAQAFVLDLTLIADYIFLNEDRHFGNFGLIRDANTGEWVGPAPLFDSGSSLFYDSDRINKHVVNAKPFKKEFSEQIKLVNLSLYYDAIKEVQNNYEQIFHESFKDCFEDSGRLESMLQVVGSQIRDLLRGPVMP